VPRLPLLAVAALAAASLALAGCGSKGTDQQQITALTRGFLADAKSHDWKGVCGAMSTKARMQMTIVGAFLGAKGCEGTMKTALTLGGDDQLKKVSPDQVRVTRLRITGDHATAKVLPALGDGSTTRFVREDGNWKLDADATGKPTTTATSGQ
jgi:hypothetical protein